MNIGANVNPSICRSIRPSLLLSTYPLVHSSLHLYAHTYISLRGLRFWPPRSYPTRTRPMPNSSLCNQNLASKNFRSYASRSISEPLLAPNPSHCDFDIGLLVLDSNLIRRGLKSLYVQIFHTFFINLISLSHLRLCYSTFRANPAKTGG